jgi:hypothetical protein
VAYGTSFNNLEKKQMKQSLFLFAALIGAQTQAQKLQLPPIEFGVTATTNQVTFPDGSRRDESRSNCIEARAGSAFSLSSAKIWIYRRKDNSEAQCTLSASKYVEFMPNFLEPSRLCANAYVVSVGGTARAGRRGELECKASVSEYDAETIFKAPSQRSGDVEINNPSVPLAIVFNADFVPFFETAIPIRALNARIQAAISESLAQVSPDLKVTVPSQGFVANPYDSRELTYFVDVDANYKIGGVDVGVRCDAVLRLLIPISKQKSIKVFDAGTKVSCRSGSAVAKLFDFELRIKKLLSDQVNGLLSQSFDLTRAGINITTAEDPELAQFAEPAWFYGRNCRWQGEPAICFGLTWTNRQAFLDRIKALQTPLPPAGSIDAVAANTSLDVFESWAKSDGYYPSAIAVDKFPAGFHKYNTQEQTVEDNDMVLFSGIMCTYGISSGCDLVKRSIDTDGRPWRSPRRIGEPWTKDSATFSGDHLKGLLLYWVKTGDKQSFERFLDYIKKERTLSPSVSAPLQIGYSTCPQREPNFTCMIGSDWSSIRDLAKRFGLESKLPGEIYVLASQNQLDARALTFEAAFSVAGFRLHLVAADILIDIGINGRSALTNRLSIMLSNRQPNNPFFALLAEGQTARVQKLVDSQCPVDKARQKRWDWSWQRAGHRQAWKEGMIWDCYMAYYALVK